MQADGDMNGRVERRSAARAGLVQVDELLELRGRRTGHLQVTSRHGDLDLSREPPNP